MRRILKKETFKVSDFNFEEFETYIYTNGELFVVWHDSENELWITIFNNNEEEIQTDFVGTPEQACAYFNGIL